ncbi:MAG: chorismate-binding protein [Crocinitomicaceae bacterium]
MKEFEFYFNANLPGILSKKKYLAAVNKLVRNIKNEEFKKVVFSRVIEKPITKSPDTIFENLCKAYPSAFVYLITASEFGTWIGATPETFVQIENSTLKTTALAGTKTDVSAEWGKKEIEEQVLVSDYIENVLRKVGCLNIQKTKPFTFNTGAVYHLKTDFKCLIKEEAVSQLINNLHPTPATCGLPKQEVMKKLANFETHNRLLYTGFLGPFSRSKAELYVNLRCMQIIKDKAYLYVGGGITSDSIAESEWNETINKSKTLSGFLN